MIARGALPKPSAPKAPVQMMSSVRSQNFHEIQRILVRQEKGTQTQTSWSGYLRVGWGVFHVKGWGAKKFGMSLETREIKLFGRDIPEFCWDILAVPGKV